MNFNEKIKKQEEENKGFSRGGGDWYKFTEGENKFRILNEPELIFKDFKLGICYTDCGFQGSSKFMCNVLDRKDNKIKLAEIPYTIGTTIAGYEADPDYQFQGFPMPYDIKVNAKGAGTKEVEYTVIPARANEPLTAEITEAVSKLKPIPEIIQKMKDGNKEKHLSDGTWDKNHQGLTDEQKKSIKEARDAEIKAREQRGENLDEGDIDVGEIPF